MKQVFTERPANDPQTERMRPDLVIEFLARYPAAVISYLEYLIFMRKLQVGIFHNTCSIVRLLKQQECIPVGCVPAARWPYAAAGSRFPGGGGVCSQGGSAPGGCLLLGGGLLWSRGGGCIPACTEADPPPWTEFLTHACENITLAQLVAAGKIFLKRLSMFSERNISHPSGSFIFG